MLSSATRILKNAVDSTRAETVVRELFDEADLKVGSGDSDDLRVNDPRFYGRLLRDGTLGLGESYVEGWWDAPRLDETLYKLLRADLYQRVLGNWRRALAAVRAKIVNPQDLSRSFRVGQRHYDLGNDLYSVMLDERMVYTCGYWKNATTLDEAQEAKLDLVCTKLGLQPGMHVLELGCGWGSFAKFAAERYGVVVTGYTVSKEQVELGMARCKGLPVDLRLSDYREASGTYDAVVSIGLMEHVGPQNYRGYMELADRCLAKDGTVFVHTIAGNRTVEFMEPWLERYIFHGAVLPSMENIGKAIDDLFVVEDLHNFGPDYDRTLMAWHANFNAAWPTLSNKYDESFRRMWNYYLLCSAASFRARFTQLYQFVFTRPGTNQPSRRS